MGIPVATLLAPSRTRPRAIARRTKLTGAECAPPRPPSDQGMLPRGPWPPPPWRAARGAGLAAGGGTGPSRPRVARPRRFPGSSPLRPAHAAQMPPGAGVHARRRGDVCQLAQPLRRNQGRSHVACRAAQARGRCHLDPDTKSVCRCGGAGALAVPLRGSRCLTYRVGNLYWFGGNLSWSQQNRGRVPFGQCV